MAKHANILQEKVDVFIKKYHLFELVKGIILALIISLSYFLLISLTELTSYFSPRVKTILVYTFFVLNAGNFLWFIIKPTLHYTGLLNTLSERKANALIVRYFPEIKDHLLNTLELLGQHQSNVDNSLLIASINQKTKELSPFHFNLALDISAVKRYSIYAVLLFTILFACFTFWPNFSKSAVRIINYSSAYKKPAPFDFKIKSLQPIMQGASFTLEVEIVGSTVPSSLLVHVPFGEFYMKHASANVFQYEFNSLNESISFFLKAGQYESEEYILPVFPAPGVTNLELSITPPSYTNLPHFTSSNNTALSVPEGSEINWSIATSSVDRVSLILNDSTIDLNKTNESYSFKSDLYSDVNYSFIVYNEYFIDSTISNFSISIEKDQYPKISILEKQDTTGRLFSYFKGSVSDDYGFSKLNFNLKLLNTDSVFQFPVSLDYSKSSQAFFYTFDFSQYPIGSNFEYFFTVYDNDGVNGPKSTISDHRFYNLPTEQALAELETDVNDKLKNSIDQSIEQAKDIQKEISNLKNKLLNEKMSEWQRNQLLDNITNQHNELKQLVEQVNKSNEQKNQLFENLSDKSELKKKQEELQELLSQVMDDELQKLMDELDKLKENFDRNKLFELSEDLEMSFEDLEKQLDKDIELLKKYDLERKFDNTIQELKDLSDIQSDVSDKLEKKEEQSADIAKQKAELSKLQEKYNELLKDNSELENKLSLEEFKNEFQEISNELDKTQQQNQSGNPKKASQSMKNASDKSKDLAEQMQQMMQKNLEQQSMENIDDLRQILDNLIIFSFDEESLIDETAELQYKDPRIPEMANKQQLLKENFTVIEDSLYALAKREPMISNQINKEILDIQKHLRNAISAYEDNRKGGAAKNQRYVMTGTNNLALLLSEILKQMQMQMAQQMKGNQQCQNPSSQGKGSPSLSQIKSQQQSLKQQLQQMIDQMKSEQSKNGNKPGGKNGMSKQLSQMLSEQEKYGQQLEQMLKDGQFSPKAMQELHEIKKMMDQNERDISNRNISQSTLFRQDQIMSRLLEAETAEREREQDKKRKSESGSQNLVSSPEEYFYKEMQQNNFQDVIEHSSLELNKVYKKIYEDYLIKLSSDN